MHPDDPKPDAADEEAARLLQEGLDPIEPDPSARAELWQRIAQRTGADTTASSMLPRPALPKAPAASPPAPGAGTPTRARPASD